MFLTYADYLATTLRNDERLASGLRNEAIARELQCTDARAEQTTFDRGQHRRPFTFRRVHGSRSWPSPAGRQADEQRRAFRIPRANCRPG